MRSALWQIRFRVSDKKLKAKRKPAMLTNLNVTVNTEHVEGVLASIANWCKGHQPSKESEK